MHYSKRKIIAMFFAVVVIVTASCLFFGTKKTAPLSLREAACAFEDSEASCIDSLDAWKDGLLYFDSVLAVTGDTVGAVKSLFWNHWNLRFIGQERSGNPEAIFPRRVLESGISSCVGATWLALMLKEARNIRIDAILLPGHIFFRTCDINMEPNRSGFSYTDAEYRRKYAAGPWTGYEFSPLHKRQFLGIVAFNLGNALLNTEPGKALAWYKVASEFFPAYPGIETNRILALKRLSRSDRE